jgi:hypothetical protein
MKLIAITSAMRGQAGHGRDNYPRISAVRSLSTEESTRYEDAVRYLHEFYASRELLPVVTAAEADLHETVQKILTNNPKHELSPRQRATLTRDVNRALFHYLASVRLYLDHTQTRLSRRYGDTSEPYIAFKRSTGREYDSLVAYRVLYHLRNFIQHCGMPIHGIGVSRRLDPETEEVIHYVRIACSVDSLLTRFSGWGKVRADLQASGELLEPHTLVPAMTSALIRVDKTVFSAEQHHLIGAAASITNLLNEVRAPGTYGTVGDLQLDGESYNLQMLDPPLELLDALGFNVR